MPGPWSSLKVFAGLLSAIGVGAAVLVAPVSADPVEEFFKGRTLRMIIGYGVGGVYDLYGRAAAEHMGPDAEASRQTFKCHLGHR